MNFCSVRYTSPLLASSPALVGKKLRIYYDVRDIRVVRAFFDDGTELGLLTAARPWCFTPHSLRVRQEIFKLIAEGKLTLRDGDSPTEAWARYRLSQGGVKRHVGKLIRQQRAEARADAVEETIAVSTKPHSVKQGIVSAPSTVPSNDNQPAGNMCCDEPAGQVEASPIALKIRKTFTF